MRYQIIPVTPFSQNCTLIWCDKTNKAAIIDPGGDLPQVFAAVTEAGVEVEKVLLTHGHIDHAAAARQCAENYGVKIIGPHKDDEPLLAGLPQQAQMFGMPPVEVVQPDEWLNEGDTVTVGEVVLKVYHTPGHAPGHVIFFDEASSTVQIGDVLFVGSIGRTDLPGGNHQQLLDTIADKIWQLGDDVTFIPGHGPIGTLGQERASNPFVGQGAQG